MPFVSQAQRAWMDATKPQMATEWQAHTPAGAKGPAHVTPKQKIVHALLQRKVR